MRLQDAPRPGWYPDPEGSARLRWWEGTDWSDRYRARPPSIAPGTHSMLPPSTSTAGHSSRHGRPPDHNQVDTQAVVEQVRVAARQEAARAAAMFGAQARSATSNLQPLITEYTTKITRWFRILSVIVIVFVIGWVAFQIFAQVSMFEWIGDRIDNLTDNTGSVLQL